MADLNNFKIRRFSVHLKKLNSFSFLNWENSTTVVLIQWDVEKALKNNQKNKVELFFWNKLLEAFMHGRGGGGPEVDPLLLF